DLSKVESRVLCSIDAAVTRPLAGSTDTMQTPFPVTPSERALAGYLGRGVKVARAFAKEYEVISGVLATSGALLGAIFRRFGCGGGGFSGLKFPFLTHPPMFSRIAGRIRICQICTQYIHSVTAD